MTPRAHTHQNAIDDASVVPGAGAFEVAAAQALEEYKHEVKGKKKLGVEAFGKALLVIPKTLAQNSGFDVLASPRMRLSLWLWAFGRTWHVVNSAAVTLGCIVGSRTAFVL